MIEPPMVGHGRSLVMSAAVMVSVPGVTKVKLKSAGVEIVVFPGNVAEPSLLLNCTVSVKPTAAPLN